MSNPTELLSRALEAYDHKEEPYFERLHHAFEDIRAYLDAEPEAEPVAYLFDADSYCDHAPIKDELVQSLPKGMLRQKIKNVRPLYTSPEPARKPMTDEELRKAFLSTNTAEPLCEGWPGLERFARAIEKQHGIGGDDE
jgi:hypothetical protein